MAKRPRLGVGAIGLHGSLRQVGGLTGRLGLVNGATYEGARAMLMATILPLIFLIGPATAATLTGKADIVDADTMGAATEARALSAVAGSL